MIKYKICFLLCFTFSLGYSQSGWTRDRYGLYAKAGYGFQRSNSYYNGEGKKFTTDYIRQQAVMLYAEYGLTKRFTAILNAPLFKSTGYESSPYRAAKGIGDMMLELKYGVLTGKYPVAVSVAPELPTGNPKALQYDKLGGYTVLPTGDGEFNVWTKAAISHSFYPVNAYFSLSGGYNFRSQGFTNQYLGGAEVGYKLAKKIWTKAALRRIGTAGIPNPKLLAVIGIGEGVEFTTYNFGCSYEWIKKVSLTFDYFHVFSRLHNIYSGSNFVVGIATELNLKKKKSVQ